MSRRLGNLQTTLRVQRATWSTKQLRLLTQAAVLSPYRDVASPVHVSCSESVAEVRMSLIRPGLEDFMVGFLQERVSRSDSESPADR